MQKLFEHFKNYPYVFGTTFIFLIGGLLALLSQSLASQITITTWSIIVVANLSVDMVKTLRSGSYGVDLLAIVAIISTLAVGEFWASLIIVLMLTGGEALEDFGARRAKRELSALLELAPKIAHLENGQKIAISKIKPGDLLLVKPQEAIPVDAILISRQAVIDESSLTGENKPRELNQKDVLLSGSVNGDEAILIKATKIAAESEYQKIIKLVEDASSVEKSPFVRLADRYAVPFTIISFTIASLAWWLSGDPKRFAEVLVVATPCPLILAAPIALVSGMSQAAKKGIIIKSGAIIETLSRIKAVAFDKTGTLTHGNLRIANAMPAPGISEKELILMAAAAEQSSSHIIAEALLQEASQRNLSLPKATKTTDKAALGVKTIINGDTLYAGKLDYLKQNQINNLPSSEASLLTTVYVAKNNQYLGLIELTDTIRDNANETLTSLPKHGIHETLMLTGDNLTSAQTVASKLGIDQYFANCSPTKKVEIIKNYPTRPIMMVGDGINDAPVLAVADIGIAMGARGSTAASETADVVIMLDDVSKAVEALIISKRTLKIALQSILIGIGISVGLMVVAAFGFIPAIIGALLQEVVDVVVIVNALRALR